MRDKVARKDAEPAAAAPVLRDAVDGRPDPLRRGALLLISLVVVATTIDLVADLGDGRPSLHIATEIAIVVAIVVVIWLTVRKVSRQHQTVLASTRAEADEWRREAGDALKSLSRAIGQRFDAWQLSPSEKDVALLLLKGLAMKEIATLRNTSERTVRQQAQEIYRKSGLDGRAAFAAFFLQDLLL